MPVTPKFERETFFQPSGINTGAAEVANGLSQAFQAFGNAALGVAKESGRRDAEEAKRLKAIDDSTIASATADLEVEIDFAKQTFPDDPVAFQNHVEATRKGIFKELPPRLHNDVTQNAVKPMGFALNDVRVGFQTKQVNNFKVETAETVEDASITGANAALELNAEGLAASRQTIVDSMSSALYTDEDRKVVLDKFDKEANQQSMIGNALNVADTQGIAAAFEQLQQINETGIEGIAPDDVDIMVKQSKAKLDQRIKLQNDKDTKADDAIKKAGIATTNALMAEATTVHNQPEKQDEVLAQAQEALRNNEIDSIQFNRIKGEINAPEGHDDIELMSSIYDGIYGNTSTQATEEAIAVGRSQGFLTPQTATKLRKENGAKANRIASGSNGKTPADLAKKNAFAVLKIKLGGIDFIEKAFGQDKERIGDAIAEYNERILTAEEEGIAPIEIANDIASRYTLTDITLESFPKLRNPIDKGTEGAPQTLDEAEDAALNAGELPPTDPNYLSPGEVRREVETIERMRDWVAQGGKL